MRVVILGGGPCGLTAAWELARQGVSVTVVEKEEAAGGLCRTFRRDGFQFDQGGHRFISQDARLVEDIRSLMGERMLTRRRKSVIAFRRERYAYPLDLADVARNAGAGRLAGFALGYAAAAVGLARSPAPEGSFEEWIDRRFGRPLNRYFFKPYTEKLWGAGADRLASDWAGQRISAGSGAKAALAAAGLIPKPRSFASSYLYPMGGIGELFETMAARIESHGGRIITGARPVALSRKGGTVTGVVARRGSGHTLTLDADRTLSTIPLDDLAALLEPGDHPRLEYRAMRFLNIMLDGVENLSDNTWIYTPERDMIMTRVQEPKRRSPYSAPPGRTSVMLEIPCEHDDETWNATDGALLARALGALRELGFDLQRHVAGVVSTFARHAYPRQMIGYRDDVERLRSVVRRYANISTAGRQGLFKYIFMDTAMLMGRRWAERTLAGETEGDLEEIHNGATVIEAGSVA